MELYSQWVFAEGNTGEDADCSLKHAPHFSTGKKNTYLTYVNHII